MLSNRYHIKKLPDLVLYNTYTVIVKVYFYENLKDTKKNYFRRANGKYELSTMTKAELHWTGQVIWKLPAILKSSCTIDVEYFPFDIQSCIIKFSSWTYERKKKGSNFAS